MQPEKATVLESTQDKQSLFMGTMPINKLLLKLALPMILSMLTSALYNVVDSIFVGKINQDALTAVTLAFPLQNLIIALGVGVGVGVNALISRSLGEKKYDKANAYATNGIFIISIIYIAFALVSCLISESFLRWQTNSESVIAYGKDYLLICCALSFGAFYSLVFEKILCSTGKTFYAMISQLVGAAVNIILDPILIFGLIGFPRLEVKGAAIATILGQICAGITGLLLAKHKNKDVSISFKHFRPNRKAIGDIFRIGLPTVVLNAVGSVMTFSVNIILGGLKEAAITVFGVYFKIQSLVMMPLFGLTNGMVPIIAYNYGARKKTRILKTIGLAMIYATGFMIFATLITELFPTQILSLFSASPEMLEIGVIALRILFSSYIVVGANVCILTTCQALGKSVISMVCSLLRQLIVLIPTAYILGKFCGLPIVWLAFPIADIFSTIIAFSFGLHVYRKCIKPIPLESTIKNELDSTPELAPHFEVFSEPKNDNSKTA